MNFWLTLFTAIVLVLPSACTSPSNFKSAGRRIVYNESHDMRDWFLDIRELQAMMEEGVCGIWQDRDFPSNRQKFYVGNETNLNHIIESLKIPLHQVRIISHNTIEQSPITNVTSMLPQFRQRKMIYPGDLVIFNIRE